MVVADYFAGFLKSHGVKRIFGLPGGENVLLIDAFRHAGLEFVLVHHEAAAGFAADVTGQLLGRPGVCLSTVGPGAMNLLSTAASATLERSPVLAITAGIDEAIRDHVSHMKVDLQTLFAAATKGSFQVTAQNVASDLATAWRLAGTPPFGAVHLSLTPAAAAQEVQSAAAELQQPPEFVAPQEAVPDKDEGFNRVFSLLRAATNPLILAGIGVEMAVAQQSLEQLADSWQVPVTVTPKAKGHFPESHPLFAGCFTAYGDAPLRNALSQGDLILGVGLDGVDLITSTWDIKTPLVSLKLAKMDDPVFQPVVSLVGNLIELLERLRPARSPAAHGAKRAASLRAAIANALITPFPEQPGSIKLSPLIAALRQALPADGAVTVDVGAFKLVFLQQWQTDRPKSLFVANGLSAMGYALPSAVALKLAQPERPVVAVVGDGALLMYAGELATVSRINKPMVILVVVDQALSLIRLKQLRNSVPVFGTEFGRTDYGALASAFGLDYLLVDGPTSAESVLCEAIQRPRPILIEARVDGAEYDHFR